MKGDKKYTVPENWAFQGARRLFKEPEVTPAADLDLKWEKPDMEGLVKFMCEKKGFAEDRIRYLGSSTNQGCFGHGESWINDFLRVFV